MKKSSKSSLKKKRSLDISLQHKNQASYKFSKTTCTWPKTGLALKGLIENVAVWSSGESYTPKK